MNVRDDLDVGVSTHTGPVRGANEDDFVLFEREDSDGATSTVGRLFAVADGMGGVAGGAEASRTAVRALLGHFLQSASDDLVDRVRDGFAHAAQSVYASAKANPQLADMGTTMTAVAFQENSQGVVIGHVGDSRCLRLRDRTLDRLTEDHAIEEPRHLLTRCLGAGRPTEQVDLAKHDLRPGDTFVLMSDGTWGPLEEAAITSRLRSASSAQQAAESLVEAALDAGTTDNTTALVVRVLRVGDLAARVRDVDLPVGEASLPLGAGVPEVSPPRWPWLVLAVAAVVAAIALLRLLRLI